MDSEHANEVDSGARFAFGANWIRFLAIVDEERIARAEDSLLKMLELMHSGAERPLLQQ